MYRISAAWLFMLARSLVFRNVELVQCGIVCCSWHYASDLNMLAQDPVRSNILNSMSQILELFSDEKHEVIMKVDPAANPSNYAVVFVHLKGD